ncbi:PAS domain S-box protein [Methylobacterium sp. J-068]|nr:PAS domain S-box protein [Methylobacterium sp. J-068]MCJ2036147.1 PAS domain S-box protein [Methylobacterium sp. J-068]
MSDSRDFLAGSGEMATLMRAYEWTATPLGKPEGWPSGLRTAVRLLLNSHHPMHIFWGPEATFFYNDGFVPSAGPERHPSALGRPASESWGEIWPVIGSEVAKVRNGGGHTWYEDQHVPILREGRVEDAYWTYGFSPIDDETAPNGIGGVISILTETTKRKALEANLRSINQSLERQIVERTQDRNRIWQVSQDMLLVSDLGGVFLNVSPAWTRVLGWSEAELVGRTSEWLEHPDDRERTRAEIVRLAESGAPTLAFENRFRTREGEYRDLSWTAVPEGDRFYCVARDITEQKVQAVELAAQAQEIALQAETLRTSRERQRVVFDLTRQLMGIMQLDGTLLEANPASLDAIGAELGDVVGKPFWTTPWFSGTPGMGDAVRGAVEVARNGQSTRTELPLILPNGETRIYDFGMHPVRDTSGRVVEIMPEATDITELRRAEEALRQSQKMEAVGQLTGGLAHDFNNLLAGISGSLEMMQNRMQQGRFQDVERYMAVAQGASKRAASLTHRLLAFSRRQTLDPKTTDVNRLVWGMHEMIQRTVGPSIPVEVVGASGLWAALVDPPQLENALLNLCINARDAMPDGGRITIETHNKWIDERVSRKLNIPEGQYLSLCVTDTGTGMTPDVIARVFEPFFTTKPMGEGTGLGLSMIYGFAQQSGGQVRIYSEVGEGSTVCIYLPRHYGKIEDEEGAAKLVALDRSDQGETVLVVDDEPSVRMLITDILEDLGYLAIEASDSAAGLKVLQSDVRIDLLVTDVGLPGGMNGRQMSDAAHVSRPDLKVLFITGYAENAILGNGTLPPGMSVLTKPFAMDAMATRIRSLIETGKEAKR